MESEEDRMTRVIKEEAETGARHRLNKERQLVCKGGQFSVQENKKESIAKNMKFVFDVVNTGCKNERRNGSAWCQVCSDNK